ncbi:hypothetical protein ACIXKX_18600 [Bacteroides fragilis]|jgi:hypothetical protein|uniref:hypothetical protein n=1 Tax=Bacteroides fragilis TaxID=817 RepID=UPI0022AA54A1|nr:hypothetical protein [Bacteroides fragilis]MCS2567226.1 hypothetical protein [Bacteroides fragilis]MCZ2503853.1 hypothetical protein [Bacteroides fragilis]
MTKFKFRNFKTGFHSPTEDQIVLHAICNLLHKEYQPITQGVSAFDISSRICKILAEYEVKVCPTNDLGTCSCILQDLIDLLGERDILSNLQIESECLKVANEYSQDCIPPMNLNL